MTENNLTGGSPAGVGTGTETTDPDPWEGIPAALIERGYSYDRDTAGGCG